ncbi:unnamed protein product, partial [Mesorhabditis spiculigera]
MTEPDELEMAPLNAPNAVEHESSKSIEYYNRHTRVSHNTANGKTTFLFDYGEEGAAGRVNLEELLKLYDQAKLEVIRHPMVLNYINEILLGAATWYMFQLLTQYGYLFLLMAYCLTRAGLFTELLILYSFVYTLTTKELALMPIIATLPIWIQIFITLKVSPVGTYIFMLRRIIFSFAKIMVIWILLIMMFALAFFIVMRELNVEPWANMGKLTHHSTFGDHIFLLAQIFIKASSMMIGELDTNHVLNTRKWEASILLLAFQIINAILFMNLLVSVSVGDVDDLKKDARDKLLKAKVAYAMEVAHSRSGFYQYLSKKKDIWLDRRQWFPSILVLAFEIITGILLMNLMVSLAVGDASDLRSSAQDKLLKIKVSSVIEALQFSQALPQTLPDSCKLECSGCSTTNNVLIVERDGHYFTLMRSKNDFRNATVDRRPASELNDHKYRLDFTNPRMRVRIRRELLAGRHQMVHLEDCQIVFKEAPDSGIPNWQPEADEAKPRHDSRDGWQRRYAKWLIGLDWTGYLDL